MELYREIPCVSKYYKTDNKGRYIFKIQLYTMLQILSSYDEEDNIRYIKIPNNDQFCREFSSIIGVLFCRRDFNKYIFNMIKMGILVSNVKKRRYELVNLPKEDTVQIPIDMLLFLLKYGYFDSIAIYAYFLKNRCTDRQYYFTHEEIQNYLGYERIEVRKIKTVVKNLELLRDIGLIKFQQPLRKNPYEYVGEKIGRKQLLSYFNTEVPVDKEEYREKRKEYFGV